MNLVQIVRDQKQELMDSLFEKKIIDREAKYTFKRVQDSKLIKVVTGVRRCGKSFLISTMLNNRKFAYMNFDDDRLANLDTGKILPAFYEIYGKDTKIIFFDEIQNVDRWEMFVNRLHRTGFNVMITGSNAKMLSKELASHLTGRHVAIELFPFSFREYLDAISFNEDMQTTKGIGLLRNELKNYINNGGFPEIIMNKENPKIYLRELYRKIIERDIIQRFNISYKKTFRELAITLLSNPGRKISYNKLKKQFALGSEHTVKNYLSYLEEAYIIFLLSRVSSKPIEIEKSEKKVYSIDTGMVNNVSFKTTDDHGHLYENTVAIELFRQRALNAGMEIYYWKNIEHEEVDFLVKQGTKTKSLIQVCYNLDDPDTKKREIRSLLKASKELRCSNLLIITDDYEAEEKHKGKKIKFIPLWKWLLLP